LGISIGLILSLAARVSDVHGPTGLKELFPATGLWMKRLMRKIQCFWNFGDTSGSDAAVIICGEMDNFLSMDLSFLPWYQTRHFSFP